jgi:hypothetical protein
MKTITLTLYSFNELSKEAKQKAIENERENVHFDFIYDDAYKTVKEFNDLFNTKEGNRSWLDFSTSSIDDNVLQLKGLRLRKYILNNFGNQLFKPKFIGSLENNNIYTHKRIKSKRLSNGNVFNPYCSGVQKDNSCVLTGACYDNSILKPIYDFIEFKGDYSHITFDMLMQDCFDSLEKDIENEKEYLESDEAILETINANEYTFEANGKRNNG